MYQTGKTGKQENMNWPDYHKKEAENLAETKRWRYLNTGR